MLMELPHEYALITFKEVQILTKPHSNDYKSYKQQYRLSVTQHDILAKLKA